MRKFKFYLHRIYHWIYMNVVWYRVYSVPMDMSDCSIVDLKKSNELQNYLDKCMNVCKSD